MSNRINSSQKFSLLNFIHKIINGTYAYREYNIYFDIKFSIIAQAKYTHIHTYTHVYGYLKAI